MGLDYSCRVIFGVDITPEEIKSVNVVTKYNVNTGEPYTKQITTSKLLYNDMDYGDLINKIEDCNQIELYCGYGNVAAVGLEFSDLEPNDICDLEHSNTWMNKNEKQLTQILEKLGILEKPRLLVLYACY